MVRKGFLRQAVGEGEDNANFDIVSPTDSPFTGPTGTVDFYADGSYIGSAELADGSATLQIDSLGVGDT